jgi:hypothetical protein
LHFELHCVDDSVSYFTEGWRSLVARRGWCTRIYIDIVSGIRGVCIHTCAMVLQCAMYQIYMYVYTYTMVL